MIIKNVSILQNNHVLENQDILIKGSKIEKIGKELPADGTGDQSFSTKVLAIPALVNAHTHTGMAFLRGIADDRTFEDWLFKEVLPREERLTPEDIYWNSVFSQMEMARYGIALFNDMYMHPDQVCQAIADFGMKACVCRGLVDTNGDNGRLDENLHVFRKWHQYQNRIRVGFGPHAPYTCSDSYLRRIKEVVEETCSFLHIHIRESKRETVLYTIEKLVQLGIFEVPSFMAHCVHLTEEEISLFKGSKAVMLHNPSSNLKLANGVAPLRTFEKNGIPILLGTDSVASNNALDIWREMLLTAIVQKGVSGDPTVFPASRVLEMATTEGYRYLGFGDSGKIDGGWRADIAFINIDELNYLPSVPDEIVGNGIDSIVSHLVYSSSAKDVVGTMVDGKWVYLLGKFPTIDEKIVKEKVLQTAIRTATVSAISINKGLKKG